MPLVVLSRTQITPSCNRARKILTLGVIVARIPNLTSGYAPQLRSIIVREILLPASSRKRTLKSAAGLSFLKAKNPNALLYRKQQWPHLSFPVFTPFRRRVKALGWKVAPVFTVGGTGTGMDLTHALGLTLMKLGGTTW